MLTSLRVFILRVRVTLARELIRGTDLEIARTQAIEESAKAVWMLRNYIKRSGGLNVPPRLRAYRIILRATDNLHGHIRRIGLPSTPTTVEARKIGLKHDEIFGVDVRIAS